ncbi:hypothetical protein KIM67_01895 [Flagellimonas sp. 389]|uniref:hypothetical protein n=1 Tax=Flagellimonas sp. 389 TaxID=2835862 RepID=UPI001BD2CA9D|nr:hypothetical protein [Flagellimonas sp. 389]MBS9461146.1 hypothetical protein [Flagellimonas sp. 389]
MKTPNIDFSIRTLKYVSMAFILAWSVSCSDSSDEDGVETESEIPEEGSEEPKTPPDTASECSDPSSFIFNEKDGLVNVEFENAEFSGDWELQSTDADHTGEGYMVWTGNQSLGNPGNGLTTFKINITNTGTYQFIWRSSVKTGDNGTEHNDTWLRFDDADDFFGEKGDGSIVYPAGRDKSPTPEGSSKDGWFKIYRSGNDIGFKWQARTSDNDAHDIFVKFDTPGTYTMEISARSSGHAIDKFVLFNDSFSKNDATDSANALSEITCGD